MSVTAQTANDSTGAANIGLVDMRDAPAVLAGTFVYQGVDLDTGWHTHDLHQLEYAVAGIAEVESRAARFLLPPQQAMWIPAGCEHRTTLRDVHSIAVFFDPSAFPTAAEHPRVVAAPPILREMLRHATRWPIGRTTTDDVADTFLAALADLTAELLGDELPLALPTTDEPTIRAVMDETRYNLHTTARDVARTVGISERTLRRRFLATTGMTWSQYLTAARVLRAIALLVETDHTITRIAHDVGFGSPSALARAFRHHTGQTPSSTRSGAAALSRATIW